MRHAGLIRIRVPFLLGFKTPLTLKKATENLVRSVPGRAGARRLPVVTRPRFVEHERPFVVRQGTC